MSSSITNTIAKVFPGYGNATVVKSKNASLTTTSEQTNSVTSITPTFHAGYVRIKVDNLGGTTPAVAKIQVSLTDGSATRYIAVLGDAAPTSAEVEFVVPFMVDIDANAISVLTTLSGTNPTADLNYELVATN